jgi:hypothetical protein
MATKRTIMVSGRKYEYVVGNSFVSIRTPQGNKLLAWCHEVAGQSSGFYEARRDRSDYYGSVKPSHVEAYIRKVEKIAIQSLPSKT